MARPDRLFAWHLLAGDDDPEDLPAPRHRLRLALGLFVLLLAIVLARAAQLQWNYGEAYRAAANRPIERREVVAAVRGSILAHDGTVLACDQQCCSLAVAYRYLEQPTNRRWIEQVARARLLRPDRRRAERVASEVEKLESEIRQLHARLAALCNLSDKAWSGRAGRIQSRVARMVELANRRHQARSRGSEPPSLDPALQSWRDWSWRLMHAVLTPREPPPAAHLVLAEELDYHVMAEQLTAEVVAEVESHPDRYRGVRVIRTFRRAYPEGNLAAHVVGHLGAPSQVEESSSNRRVGRMGVERSYESLLCGDEGRRVIQTDRRGHALSEHEDLAPRGGRDVRLTIDPALQRAGEMLLERACASGSDARGKHARGAAAVVIDIRDGAILTAASVPRFNPNWFEARDTQLLRAAEDAGRPFFDRPSMMCLPPGSVFKALTACALLEEGVVRPGDVFDCQGYLVDPEAYRCHVYRRFGVGHGEITLADALAQSCNVYFFHHAQRLAPGALDRWSAKFGFGSRTGIDLPGEAAGQLATPAVRSERTRADTLQLSIGQGKLTATPLQVVRLMAAVANGGYLVRPHVAATSDVGSESSIAGAFANAAKVPGLDAGTLAAVRRGLKMVVNDPTGTGYSGVRLDGVAIAGKTGTAETGGGQGDHAWFAGYVPADAPRFALVVVLENAGSGGAQAGPVAREIVLQLRRLGYLDGGKKPAEFVADRGPGLKARAAR